MAIQGIIYSNQRVAASEHAALFQMLISDGTISGCGFSVLRNTLTISSGLFIVAGRLTRIIGSETLDTGSNVSKTMKLIGRCDMTHDNDPSFDQFYFTLVENNYELRKEAINTDNGQYYEIEWATITIDSQGVITSYNVTIGESQGGGTSGDNHLTSSDFEYINGQYQFETSGDDWELAFLSSGSFKLTKNLRGVDIFIVGAGFDGNTNIEGSHTTNHDGGDGGYYRTWESDSLTAGTYEVVIGDSSGTVSSIGERAVSSADDQKSGGVGAHWDTNRMLDGTDGSDGVYAFGSSTSLIFSGRKYGASAGGGGEIDYQGGQRVSGIRGNSGQTGAGVSGNHSWESRNGENATANTGSGGGARGKGYNSAMDRYDYGSPGAGGSGIIIIRNHRAA